MKKLIIILGLVMMLGLVASQDDRESIGTFAKGTNVTLIQECSTCSYVFLTKVYNKENNTLVSPTLMTKAGSSFTYILTDDKTQTLGPYTYCYNFSATEADGTGCLDLYITPDGTEKLDTGRSLIILGVIAILLMISILSGYMSFRSANGWASLGFLGFSILILVFNIGLLLNFLELSLIGFEDLISNYSLVYTVMIALMGVGMVGLIIYLIVFTLKKYWEMRGYTDKFSGLD